MAPKANKSTNRVVDPTHVPLKFKVTAIILVVCVFAIFSDERLIDSFTWFDIYESYLSSNCQVPHLDKQKYIPSTSVSCQRPPPIRGSCDVARQVFFAEPTPTCAHQTTYDICRIKSDADGFHVNCTNKVCKQAIFIGIVNSTIGAVYWKRAKDISQLEHSIQNLIMKNESSGNYGFCFLNCSLSTKAVASQLLLLPQNITKNPCEKDGTCNENSVNINILWLDSTSHSHFYRSMPKTVQILRDIKESNSLNVFNYNLMQSIKGGTYVNTVAFTGGKIFTRNYLLKNEPGIGNLLKVFQNGGYHVSLIDDLCWTWSRDNCACGIPKFVGVKTGAESWVSKIVLRKQSPLAERWGNVSKEIKAKGINDIGASLANCEMMKANGLTDPFHSGESHVAICYNGLYQTDYIMSSLELLHSQLKKANRPQLTYLDLNLGHESTGRRIQTLDASLAKFMSFLSHQNNTLTLMFGDHGNKYGTFVQKSKESKIEMAHPVLFVLASNDVATKLGRDWMSALNTNQDRLVNILDLRQTMLSLAPNVDVKSLPMNSKYDNHPNGLFHPISRKRTCDSMGVDPEAGRCICQQGRVRHKLSNKTGVVVLANLALGEINNKIQEQFLAANGNKVSRFGNCRYLMGSWIANVQQTVSQNITNTEMDIHVPAGTGAPQSEDVFSVVIQVGSNNPALSSNIKLVHYERISTYAVYDGCRDVGVDGDLCVCATTPVIKSWNINPPIQFGYKSTVTAPNRYLRIYERRTPHGLVLETSCTHTDTTLEVVFSVTTKVNVAYSQKYPLTFTLKHGSLFFIDIFYQRNPKLKWDVKYDVDFKQL